jgi:hypothetical protein
MASGFRDGTPRVVLEAFPSTSLGNQVVPYHYQLITGKESLTHEDVGRFPSPRWGGRGAHHASSSRVLCRRADVWALT